MHLIQFLVHRVCYYVWTNINCQISLAMQVAVLSVMHPVLTIRVHEYYVHSGKNCVGDV